MSTCRECGKPVSSDAASCPHCGVKKPVHKSVGIVGIVLAAVFGLFVFKACSNMDAKPLQAAPSTPPTAAEIEQTKQRERAEAAEAKRMCVDEVALLVKQASDELKSGKAEAARRTMEACDGKLQDPVALALVEKIKPLADKAEAKRVAADVAAEKARRKREGVSLGMSMQDVLDSSWGKPERVNRTTNAYGTDEQWVYSGSRGYLYFKNGALTSIQN